MKWALRKSTTVSDGHSSNMTLVWLRPGRAGYRKFDSKRKTLPASSFHPPVSRRLTGVTTVKDRPAAEAPKGMDIHED